MSAAHPELLVSLAALPGFDPVGLRVTTTDDSGRRVWAVVVSTPESMLRVVSLGRKPTVYSTPSSGWCVDFADAATRDRATRWMVSRLGPEESCHYGCRWWPLVNVTVDGPRWALGHDGRYTTFAATGWHVVPELEALDPRDLRQLPDGSRWVDARALAFSAVHLGQQVTP